MHFTVKIELPLSIRSGDDEAFPPRDGPAGAAEAGEECPEWGRASSPPVQEDTVDQVKPLASGELPCRLGEPAVGDEDDDIAPVHGTSGAVEDMKVWRANGRSGSPVAVG